MRSRRPACKAFRCAAAAAIAPLLWGCATGSGAGGGEPTEMELLGISLRIAEETYTVTGRTVAEIGESLRRRSPRAGSVRGVHSYRIRWKYSLQPAEGGCLIANVEVELESTVLLPRWVRSAGAEFEMEELWRAYLQEIRDHEDRHRSLAIQSALEIQHELQQIEAATSVCSPELSARANAVGTAIVNAYQERNEAFDRSSGGVRWPPY